MTERPGLPPWPGDRDRTPEDRLLPPDPAREQYVAGLRAVAGHPGDFDVGLQPVPWGSPGDDPDPPRLHRRPDTPTMPRIIGTAREDLPAGASVVLDLNTGLVYRHRPEQEHP